MSGGECGLDNFSDGLRAVGEHERHFSHGRERVEPESSKQGANAVAGGVPPGWRVMTGARPRFCIHAAKRLICVVLPEPSRPSRVMNNPRGMPRVYHP